MKIPKEIADKAKEYQEAKKKADKAYEIVTDWLNENTDSGDVYIEDIFIKDAPKGKLRHKDEYCDEHCGHNEDDVRGTYWHQVDGEKYFLGYSFWA